MGKVRRERSRDCVPTVAGLPTLFPAPTLSLNSHTVNQEEDATVTAVGLNKWLQTQPPIRFGNPRSPWGLLEGLV